MSPSERFSRSRGPLAKSTVGTVRSPPRAGILPILLLATTAWFVLDAGTAWARTGEELSADDGAGAAEEVIDPGYLLVKDLLSNNGKTRRKAAKQLASSGDRSLVFGIVDALFFIPRLHRIDAVDALRALTGESTRAKYWEWVEVAGRLGEEIRPAPGYDQWKKVLFAKIDPGYEQILSPGAPRTLRLEEVVSGGVPIEGIPSLDDPSMIAAAEARYLDDDEDIFGVVIGGEARAYPLRILDWHEMLNDTVGGQPITLSYCTLCGSGVLFHTGREDGSARRFGTSGLLYRSNKLMFDRETRTLWSNLRGKPVFGSLVGQDLELELLPHTRTTWGEWKNRHPETLVVEIDKKLKRLGSDHGFDYRPGQADRARRGVSFPVWKKSPALAPETEVYVLRQGEATTAYPVETLLAEKVINDTVGDTAVVLVTDPSSGAVRAYRRSGELRPESEDALVDTEGRRYLLTETALEAEDGSRLERLPGHFAYWFGWYAFFPRTEVYGGPIVDGP